MDEKTKKKLIKMGYSREYLEWTEQGHSLEDLEAKDHEEEHEQS